MNSLARFWIISVIATFLFVGIFVSIKDWFNPKVLKEEVRRAVELSYYDVELWAELQSQGWSPDEAYRVVNFCDMATKEMKKNPNILYWRVYRPVIDDEK